MSLLEHNIKLAKNLAKKYFYRYSLDTVEDTEQSILLALVEGGLIGETSTGVEHFWKRFCTTAKSAALNTCKTTNTVELADLIDARVDIPQEVMDLENRCVLLDMIVTLQRQDRQMIEMYFFEGLPVREIAMWLNIHHTTVVRRMNYLLRELGKIEKKLDFPKKVRTKTAQNRHI